MTIIKIRFLLNVAFVAWILCGPAQAQQPTPAQTAIQIDNVVNQWAQQLDAQAQNLKAAQEQIEDKDKQIKNLREKCGTPCQSESK